VKGTEGGREGIMGKETRREGKEEDAFLPPSKLTEMTPV